MNTVVTSATGKPAAKQPNAIARFLRDVYVELKKTDWPSRDELTKYVVVVLVTIVAVSIFLWLSDQIAAFIMTKIGVA